MICVLWVVVAVACGGSTDGLGASAATDAHAPASPAPIPVRDPEPIVRPVIERVLAEQPYRAVGVVVVEEGRAHVVAFGPRSVATGAPFGPHSSFEIGSVSKVFVGLLLADAVARGEVALDDPLVRHLPPGWTVPPGGEAITLLQLATHTAGFPMMPTNWVMLDPVTRRTRYDEAMFREFVAGYVLPGPPGSRYEYGNVGTALLAIALSHRAGLSFRELLAARVFAPLGMRESDYRDRPLATDDVLDGYGEDETPHPPRVDTSPVGPCCAISTTLDDMARFLSTAVAGGGLDGLFRAVESPRYTIADGHTIGLLLEHDARLGFHLKSGQVAGYRSKLLLDRAGGRGLFVVVNSEVTDIELLAYDLAVALWSLRPAGTGRHAALLATELPAGATRGAVELGGEALRLEGWEAPAEVRAGDELRVVFYWRCRAALDRDYRIFVHVDAAGPDARIGADHFPAGDTTLDWRPGELIRDEVVVPLPADYAASSLQVWTGFYRHAFRLPASGPEGTVDRDRVRGPTVRVVRSLGAGSR